MSKVLRIIGREMDRSRLGSHKFPRFREHSYSRLDEPYVLRSKCDPRPFYEALQEEFETKSLPQSLLGPAFRKRGVGSCLIHVLRRRGVDTDQGPQPNPLLPNGMLPNKPQLRPANEDTAQVIEARKVKDLTLPGLSKLGKAELTKLMEDQGLPYSSGMTVEQMKNALYTYDPGEG